QLQVLSCFRPRHPPKNGGAGGAKFESCPTASLSVYWRSSTVNCSRRESNMLTYDMARQMVDAAVAHARANGLAMTSAVVDQAGTLVALGRMDGSHFMAPEIARGKAYGSAAFGLPSAELA